MANYGYVRPIKPALNVQEFETLLRRKVEDVLDPRWRVRPADFEDGGPTFLVTVPGTVHEDVLEEIGWCVAVQKKGTVLAFRHHGFVLFERWAQGCLEEELSEYFQAPLHYDAGPSTYAPGHRHYRLGTTLRAYLLRNYKGVPENADHALGIERMMRGTPAGFE